MRFGLAALIALCAACAAAVPADPARPPPEPAMPRAAPPEPLAPGSPGALQQRLMSDGNFAGLYMHPPGRRTAIVLFTGADPAAQLARYTTDPRFQARGARYSLARLTEAHRALGAAFERERIYYMMLSTDIINNRVEVEVVDEAETRALARARGVVIPEEVAVVSRGGIVAERQALAPDVTHFPQARYPAGIEMDALARGRLTIENGCIRLGGGAGGHLIVWPSSAQLLREGDRIVIRDLRSGGAAAVGDAIERGGGESHELDQTHLTGPVPAACHGPYWIAASGWRVSEIGDTHSR